MKLDLSNLRRPHVSRLAFVILDAIKNEELDYLIASLGLVLEAVTEEKNLDRSDIMTKAANMLRTEGLEDDNYVTALRSYIREEIAV
jgi:hypothetical protein